MTNNSENGDVSQDQEEMEEPIKIGDFVEVKGNAKGTVWESGVVGRIKDGKAFIHYGVSSIHNSFAACHSCDPWEPITNLEKIVK